MRLSFGAFFLKNRLNIPLIKLGFLSLCFATNGPDFFVFDFFWIKSLFAIIVFLGWVLPLLVMFLICSSLRIKVSTFSAVFKTSLKTSPFVLSIYISLSIISLLLDLLIEDKLSKSSSDLPTNNEFDSEPFSPG